MLATECQLLDYIRSNDLFLAEKFLEEEPLRATTQLSRNYFPIHAAAETPNSAPMMRLLRRFALAERDDDSELCVWGDCYGPALEAATRCGRVENLLELLSHTHMGSGLLHADVAHLLKLAVASGEVGTAEYLLSRDELNGWGQTPLASQLLCVSCYSGSNAVLKWAARKVTAVHWNEASLETCGCEVCRLQPCLSSLSNSSVPAQLVFTALSLGLDPTPDMIKDPQQYGGDACALFHRASKLSEVELLDRLGRMLRIDLSACASVEEGVAALMLAGTPQVAMLLLQLATPTHCDSIF